MLSAVEAKTRTNESLETLVAKELSIIETEIMEACDNGDTEIYHCNFNSAVRNTCMFKLSKLGYTVSETHDIDTYTIKW